MNKQGAGGMLPWVYKGLLLFPTAWILWNIVVTAQGKPGRILPAGALALFESLGVYGALVVLAAVYHRLYSQLSTAFYFLVMLLVLYMAEQLGWAAGFGPQRPLLWVLFAVYILSACAAVGFHREEKEKRKSSWLSWEWWAVAGWLVYIGLYFVKANVVAGRHPVMDEISFWYTQGKDLILMHPGAGIFSSYVRVHSAGVPFLAALPNIVSGTALMHGLFYLPLIVIFGLTLVLADLVKRRWAFVFFLNALCLGLLHHKWLHGLFFSLIYGDGLSGVVFLVMMMETRRLLGATEKVKVWKIFLLAFGVGLMTFTKAPASYVYWAFLPLVLMGPYSGIRSRLAAAGCFALPFLAKQLFLTSRGWAEGLPLQTFLQYNFTILMPMLKYLLHTYKAPLLFSGVSVALCVAAFSRIEKILFLPLIILVVFVIGGYVTIFSVQEYESAGRYLAEGYLALIYLGAEAFQKIMAPAAADGENGGSNDKAPDY